MRPLGKFFCPYQSHSVSTGHFLHVVEVAVGVWLPRLLGFSLD